MHIAELEDDFYCISDNLESFLFLLMSNYINQTVSYAHLSVNPRKDVD